MYRIASALVRLIAPMLVFTAEEVWKYLPREAGEPESVHMALFPTPEKLEVPWTSSARRNGSACSPARGSV